MVCEETPRNNGLTSEFYEAYLSELKTTLLLSYKKSFLSRELSISQNETVVNPFVPNALFLYLLKTLESLTVF